MLDGQSMVSTVNVLKADGVMVTLLFLVQSFGVRVPVGLPKL